MVRKLGAPARDRWQGPAGGTRYRALWYPDRACTIVLMAGDGTDATYIGTLDANWNPLHSVRLRDGSAADPLLRVYRASSRFSFSSHLAYSRTPTSRTGMIFQGGAHVDRVAVRVTQRERREGFIESPPRGLLAGAQEPLPARIRR